MGIHYYTRPKIIPEGQRFVDKNDRVMSMDKVIIISQPNQKPVNIELQLPTASVYRSIKILCKNGSATLLPYQKDSIGDEKEGEKYALSTEYNVELISDGVSNWKVVDLYGSEEQRK